MKHGNSTKEVAVEKGSLGLVCGWKELDIDKSHPPSHPLDVQVLYCPNFKELHSTGSSTAAGVFGFPPTNMPIVRILSLKKISFLPNARHACARCDFPFYLTYPFWTWGRSGAVTKT